jgi:hypothetical protein
MDRPALNRKVAPTINGLTPTPGGAERMPSKSLAKRGVPQPELGNEKEK